MSQIARYESVLKDFTQPPLPPSSSLWLPYPPSVNELFAHVPSKHIGMIRVKTQKYRDWEREAAKWVNTQRTALLTHSGMVEVQYIATPPKTKHKRDLGNIEKALSDLLVSSRVIRDDSLIQTLNLSWDRDWPDVGVKVLIRDYVGGAA